MATSAARRLDEVRPLPRLRLVPAPGTEPAYDPPGPPPAPRAWVRGPARPRHLRLVGPDERAPAAAPGAACQARLRVRGFARVLTGVLTGRCPLQRLTPHTTHAVRATIAALRDDLRRRAVTGITLAAANATAPTPTTAEGYLRLTLTGPDRDQAIALRLDHTPSRTRPENPPTWICTAFQYK